MKTVFFYTPTLLSYIDLMSMGGSEKADDDQKIGKFSSGMKFAMALFHRHNVDMKVRVYDTENSEGRDRKRETVYNVGTYIERCEQTDKEKELLQLYKNVSAENFFSSHCTDYGGGDYPEEIIKTGYSVKLGVDWVLHMGLREIFSNMIDEGGHYSEIRETVGYGTVVELSFAENSEFDEIWTNRHLYINEKPPLHIISPRLEALENTEGYLRLYKQNILVYSNKDIPSFYAYNLHWGTLDEKRVLSDVYSVGSMICSYIKDTKNEEYLRTIIFPGDMTFPEKEFLSGYTPYGDISDLIHDIAAEIYEKHGDVKSYTWLIDAIKKRPDCKIGGKKIQSIGDSVWTYSTSVTVETKPETISEPDMEVDEVTYSSAFSAEIKKHYNFNLDVEIKQAKLKGSKVIADSYANCLIISEDFSVENDFPEFIVQYLDLTVKGNVVKNMSEYICKLLKK